MGTPFNKAIVALLVPVIVQTLITWNLIPIDHADQAQVLVSDIVTGILTLVAVYFTPNKNTVYLKDGESVVKAPHNK